jgi:hypothetical protein
MHVHVAFWHEFLAQTCFHVPAMCNSTCFVKLFYRDGFICLAEGRKVKQSHYRPGQAMRVPGCLRLPDFKTIGTWRWQVCQPSAPAAFTPNKYSWYSISVRGWIDPRAIVRPEGLCQWKNPVTPSGIEPAIFRFVAQCQVASAIDDPAHWGNLYIACVRYEISV